MVQCYIVYLHEFSTEIYGHQRVNPNDLYDTLTSPLTKQIRLQYSNIDLEEDCM